MKDVYDAVCREATSTFVTFRVRHSRKDQQSGKTLGDEQLNRILRLINGAHLPSRCTALLPVFLLHLSAVNLQQRGEKPPAALPPQEAAF